MLKSIPKALEPFDIIFVFSIPPELREKPVPIEPFVPPGTPPEEAKVIVQEALDANKAMAKQRLDAIKKLGPDAVALMGKWIVKTPAAEQWMGVYGQQFKMYTNTGFWLVALDQTKRLLQIILLGALGSMPALGPMQIKLLTLLGFVEFVIICKTRPFVKLLQNFEVIGTTYTKMSQMVAPILLGLHLVEDQFTALYMMAMNGIAVGVGVVKEFGGAILPILKFVENEGAAVVGGVLKTLLTVLVMLGYIKKKILGNVQRPKPPPPIWQLIKMPPPVINLLAEMMPPPVMEGLKLAIGDANPILKAYAQTFAKVGAEWMKKEGVKELQKQFKEVLDENAPRHKVSLMKFINRFHKAAILTVFQVCQPKLKLVAQDIYDEAMAVAAAERERRANAKSGKDPIAAAMAVINPEMVGKLTGLLSNIQPVVQQFMGSTLSALDKWLKNGGQKQIDAALKEVKARVSAMMKDAEGIAKEKAAAAAKEAEQKAKEKAKEEAAAKMDGKGKKPKVSKAEIKQMKANLEELKSKVEEAKAKKQEFDKLQARIEAAKADPETSDDVKSLEKDAKAKAKDLVDVDALQKQVSDKAAEVLAASGGPNMAGMAEKMEMVKAKKAELEALKAKFEAANAKKAALEALQAKIEEAKTDPLCASDAGKEKIAALEQELKTKFGSKVAKAGGNGADTKDSQELLDLEQRVKDKAAEIASLAPIPNMQEKMEAAKKRKAAVEAKKKEIQLLKEQTEAIQQKTEEGDQAAVEAEVQAKGAELLELMGVPKGFPGGEILAKMEQAKQLHVELKLQWADR